jgi:hypothetical protein
MKQAHGKPEACDAAADDGEPDRGGFSRHGDGNYEKESFKGAREEQAWYLAVKNQCAAVIFAFQSSPTPQDGSVLLALMNTCPCSGWGVIWNPKAILNGPLS